MVDQLKKPRFTAVVVGLLGLPGVLLGFQLLWAGGTPYFAISGVMLLVSAFYLFQANPRGFHVYALTVLLTLIWAIYESGTEFWQVGSKIWLIGVVALWLCTPRIRRMLWPDSTPALFSLRDVQACALATVVVLLGMLMSLVEQPKPLDDLVYGERRSGESWDAYGGTNMGTRYVPHDQINVENIDRLEKKWEFNTGRIGRFSGTPLQIDDGIYLCTAQNVVIALDADTGEERWRMDPENKTPPYSLLGNCRGVTYYQLPESDSEKNCAERIFTATTDARLIAMDKETGQACEDFGEKGQISLLAGMGEVKPMYYFVTSPATVASGALVVGGWVADNQEVNEPSGVVRGYSPVTGELLWAWDIGREGQGITKMPPTGETYTRGTPNVWSLTSSDDELGLVYVPTGNATPDYFGGHRTPVMDKYASSIVAIDAKNGTTRWRFQTTHHDVWDYDVPSQPTLVDLTIEGKVRKAVIVPTKRGEIFVLDRETGEPITEVQERRVPQTDLPGERSSSTQPFSVGMPSFAYPEIREEDLFGVTPIDQISCRLRFKELRYEGPMTPPSVKGTLLYPGPAGGMNWSSVAVDEERQLMVVQNTHLPWIVSMIPREEDLVNQKEDEGFQRGYGIGGPQRGTPFAAQVVPFFSGVIPCLKPPYGEMALVDLTTQEIVWRHGNGFLGVGLPSVAGGSIITAGGLIFNASVPGSGLRALDVNTGKEIWSESLPKSSEATPMSYVSPKSKRQYVLVTSPAVNVEEPSETPVEGGKVMAYALSD